MGENRAVAFRRGIWLELYAVNQLLGAAIARAVDGETREFALYSSLNAMEEATPTEIAAVLGLPLTTASDHLNRMVERGHAAKAAHPRDGRSHVFSLTADGRRLTRAQAEQFGRMIRRVRGRLSVDEERVRDVLDDLEAALRAELDTPTA